jgi:WhiB family redox-sensing transcriptional regulator
MFQIKYIETDKGDIHWRLRAACRNSDPELFMPHSRFSPEYKVAVQICQGCEVRSQCLDVAQQSRETTGVWGGVLFQRNGEQHEAS